MNSLEKLSESHPHQKIAIFDRPFENPQHLVDYPHLNAWLEIGVGIEASFPDSFPEEHIFRKLEAEKTKQIAGFIGLSSAIIIDKLGAPDDSFGVPFLERLNDFVETAQGRLAPCDQICRKEAEKFIEEALNFISDLPSAKDDPIQLRQILINFMFGRYSDLNKDNNLSIQGGMALFALALPKRSFNDDKTVRSKLVDIVKKDHTAMEIFKSFRNVLFDGHAYQPEDKLPELDTTGQYL